MSHSNRVNHQAIFVLSSSAWRENSLRLEAFSHQYGRIALLARSARTRGSELRGILVPFVPISASWYGKEELKTLHRAEWIGGWAQPKNRTLFSALYLNELLLKSTAREDPNPELYDYFYQTQRALALSEQPIMALRLFEWKLLHLLGHAPDLEWDEHGQAVCAEQHYLVRPEYALLPFSETQSPPSNGIVVSGSLLQELHSGCLKPHNLTAILSLTRLLIDHHIPEGIKSRQILQQLNQFKAR
ncbi:MAG: DNA repair protein RecO [Alysiella sp.]|uniref:DNA repair protein RecO n=1 Tax=Alysiella sp. TaxID=1872483 RepID=UPI0026DC250F|nr:DNA repair protein RecO [Alysiella sp.]MDO4434089.1 DNA repair protein RecO [Alysiella sp.]